MPLFHIVPRADWPPADGPYRPESLATEGFVHCSYADQVAGTLQRYYGGVPDLVVLELDPALIPAEVKVEDTRGSGTAFPHVYGPIPVEAAVAVHEPARFSAGRATGPASPDR